jgi:hypothetical protein
LWAIGSDGDEMSLSLSRDDLFAFAEGQRKRYQRLLKEFVEVRHGGKL